MIIQTIISIGLTLIFPSNISLKPRALFKMINYQIIPISAADWHQAFRFFPNWTPKFMAPWQHVACNVVRGSLTPKVGGCLNSGEIASLAEIGKRWSGRLLVSWLEVCWFFWDPTVDGSEIRRSPFEVGSLSHYLQGFIHPRWCRISSINSMKGDDDSTTSFRSPFSPVNDGWVKEKIRDSMGLGDETKPYPKWGYPQ